MKYGNADKTLDGVNGDFFINVISVEHGCIGPSNNLY